MKKIEILIGSPRRSGNTVCMADMFERAAEADGAAVALVHLYDADISACIDCRRCTKGSLLCPVADDMQELYNRLDAADVIVVGTPVYWYGPTAVAKLLLDRLRPYYRNRRLEGKTLVMLIPAAAGEGDCDLLIEMFRRSAKSLGMRFAGAVAAKAFDAGDLRGDAETEKTVRAMAGKLM